MCVGGGSSVLFSSFHVCVCAKAKAQDFPLFCSAAGGGESGGRVGPAPRLSTFAYRRSISEETLTHRAGRPKNHSRIFSFRSVLEGGAACVRARASPPSPPPHTHYGPPHRRLARRRPGRPVRGGRVAAALCGRFARPPAPPPPGGGVPGGRGGGGSPARPGGPVERGAEAAGAGGGCVWNECFLFFERRRASGTRAPTAPSLPSTAHRPPPHTRTQKAWPLSTTLTLSFITLFSHPHAGLPRAPGTGLALALPPLAPRDAAAVLTALLGR